MTRLTIVEPTDEQWLRWKKDGEEGARKLAREVPASIRRGDPVKPDDALYKRMKARYFDLFHGKCVYCESPLRVDSWDQLDHFRPKSAVLNLERQAVQLANGEVHPGYYWLAYEWSNLLPCCQCCNGHKGAVFPMLDGVRHAAKPKDRIEDERPLLIHPVLDHARPSTHFGYRVLTGALELKTPRARRIDQILELNREGLRDARRLHFRDTVNLVRDYLDHLKYPEDAGRKTAIEAQLRKIVNGVAAYSLVGRHALAQCASMLGPYLDAS